MQNILKNSIFAVGFLFAGVLLFLGLNELRGIYAQADIDISPQAVNTTSETSNSATVNFTTEKEILAKVIYGSSLENLPLFSIEQAKITNHALTLSFLSPNTTYYYKIELADNGQLKEFDNSGQPWSFTTKPAAQGSAGTTSSGQEYDDLDPEEFKQMFGTSDSTYDLNSDGIVNSTDYLIYLSKTRQEQ